MNRQKQVTAEDDLLSDVLVQRGSETGTPCVLTAQSWSCLALHVPRFT